MLRAMLESFTIDDDLTIQSKSAVEVTLQLRGRSPRWCFFMRPEALAASGDWIPGTRTRMHFGPHMIIVVGELTSETINHVLLEIDSRGELERCSLPLM
jgi:hypothetical protein